MTTKDRFSNAEAALARSATYGFLAAALRYPDAETISTVVDSPHWSVARQLLQRSFPALAEQLAAIRASLSAFAGDRDEQIPTLQGLYTRLLGHTVRGTCPPYELEYSRTEILQRANELADIAGFYHAFGMELAAQAHERADHVVAQCEFMSVLAARQAHVIETDNEQARQIICDAQRSFLTDHMGWWLPAFASRLQEADPDGLYGRVGMCLREFIKAECRHFDTACGPEYLELRPTDSQHETTLQCGVEESCPGAATGAIPAGGESFVQLRVDRG